MPEMTAAEALETVLEATAPKKWAEAPAEIIERLRALGFAIVPVEATKQMIAAGDMLTYREERFKVSAVWREMVSAYASDAEKGK